MVRRCPYVSFDKANNYWVARRPTVTKHKKVFANFAAAQKYALQQLAVDTPHHAANSRRRMVTHMQSLSKIYGHRQLVPADLQDAMARHICDTDVFQGEPAAEVLSVMLKYRPVRTVSSHVLRIANHKVKKTQVSKVVRARRLWQCLRRTALELTKCGAK